MTDLERVYDLRSQAFVVEFAIARHAIVARVLFVLQEVGRVVFVNP
jgi:hypothetical protein